MTANPDQQPKHDQDRGDQDRGRVLEIFNEIFTAELLPREEFANRFKILFLVVNCVIHQVRYDLTVRKANERLRTDHKDKPDWIGQENVDKLRSLHTQSTLRLEEILSDNLHLKEDFERIRTRLTNIVTEDAYSLILIFALNRYFDEFRAQFEQESARGIDFDSDDE